MTPPDVNKAKRFDLFGDPAVLALLVAFCAAFGYGLLDTFFINSYDYLGAAPIGILAGVGIAVLVGSFIAARNAPALERSAMSVLCAAAFGLAAYSVLLRLNQWTDTDGPQYVQYSQVSSSLYRSKQSDFPDVTVPRRHGNEFASGRSHVHNLELLKGGLGFYQFNDMALRRDHWEHYSGYFSARP